MLIKMIIDVFTRIRPSIMSLLFMNDDGNHVVDNNEDDGDDDRVHQIKTSNDDFVVVDDGYYVVDNGDDDLVHQIKTSNDESTLPQVCAPTTEAGNFTHLLCIIYLDGEGIG